MFIKIMKNTSWKQLKYITVIVNFYFTLSSKLIQSLGQEEDPLDKDIATVSSILAWEIPRTEEVGRLQPMGSQKSQTRLSTARTDTEWANEQIQRIKTRDPGSWTAVWESNKLSRASRI